MVRPLHSSVTSDYLRNMDQISVMEVLGVVGGVFLTDIFFGGVIKYVLNY